MASFDDYRRRSSQASTASPRIIPPAPPLPPDRPDQVKPTPGFLDRFLYGPRKLNQFAQQQQQQQHHHHHQAQPPSQPGRESRGQLPFTQTYAHAPSQSTSHRTGLKLRALDINESRSHVVLAGVKILKTVRVQQGSCAEDVNIRSAAVNYVWKDDVSPAQRSQDVSSAQRETFDIEDVAWSSQQYASNIATAAANGKIMLYDLNRPGVEVGRLYEHHRQVHKVDFNPHEGQFLLSGSQDGTVRLWDLRTPRRVVECKSKDTFPGRSDGVRHTKWSPTSKWSFALGTDNGTVQRWDIRQNRTPVLKILAHTKTCTSIDWHPDGRHMISASKDQNVKVWDLLGDRKQRPTYEVRCPKPVQNVRWRPPCYIADGPEQWIKQCTHFATSYRHHPLVHIWDLKQPYMPYRELHQRVNSGTTDLLWHSQDLLWTVGPEGEFCQSDVRYVPRTIDQRPLQAFDEAPSGDLSFFSKPRPRVLLSSDRERSKTEVSLERPQRSSRGSPSLKIGSFGRGDDGVDENFLSTSIPKRHSRSSSFKSGGSLGSTPPSYEDNAKPVTQLDQTMKSSDRGFAAQIAKTGTTPLLEFGSAFFLSSNRFSPCLLSPTSSFEVAERYLAGHLTALKHQCQLAGDYETEQSLAFLNLEFARVLDLYRSRPSLFDIRQRSRLSNGPEGRDVEISRGKKPANKALMQIKESEKDMLHPEETTSNVATPLARPIKSLPFDVDRPETPPIDLNVGSLLESPESPRKPRVETASSEDNDTEASFEPDPAVHVSGTVDRLGLASDFRRKAQAPLQFEQPQDGSESSPSPDMDRRSSPDSFQMFPTSWGAESKPLATDSAASSWTRNAIEQRLGRQSSFPSQGSASSGIWQGEKSVSGSTFDGSLATSDSSSPLVYRSSHNTSVPGGSTKASDQLAPSVQTKTPPRIVTDAEDTTRQEDPQAGEGRSPSVMSHPDSRTAMDESISSLPPMILQSQLLADMPPSIQSTLEAICELLQYHSTQNEVLAASQLFLTIAPIIPYLTATALGRTEYSASSSFNEAVGAAVSMSAAVVGDVLRSCHAPLQAAQISPYHVESVLTAFHSQLFANALNQEATLLRRVSYPAFPGVYEQSTKDVDVGIICTFCSNPINNEEDPLRCESCDTQQEECSICWSKTSPFELASDPAVFVSNKARRIDPLTNKAKADAPLDTKSASLFPLWGQMTFNEATLAPKANTTALWTACCLCAHSTHAACAQAWFTGNGTADDPDTGGMCPVPGCLCDCTPGPWRSERLERERISAAEESRTRALGEAAVLGSVRRDDWEIGESRAVRKVVGALRDEQATLSDGEGGRVREHRGLG